MSTVDIAKKIQELRIAKAYSQEDMAQKLDIATSEYARIEEDVSELKVKNLEKVAEVLETNLQGLVGAENNITVQDSTLSPVFNNIGNIDFGFSQYVISSEENAQRHLEWFKRDKKYQELIEKQEKIIETLMEKIEKKEKR